MIMLVQLSHLLLYAVCIEYITGIDGGLRNVNKRMVEVGNLICGKHIIIYSMLEKRKKTSVNPK